VLGYYPETKTHSDGSRSKFTVASATRSEVREPFIHLYSEDPHTILEVRGAKFEWAALLSLKGVYGDQRWVQVADNFAKFYNAKQDLTLFKTPEEVTAITAALNVDVTHGIRARRHWGTSSSDDTPIAMVASRIIVYSLVFGL
jgi:hypothetical protein